MKREINILPADTFVVVNRTILNESDRKIINEMVKWKGSQWTI